MATGYASTEDTYHGKLVREDALAENELAVEVRLSDRGLADEMAEWLAEQGGYEVTEVRERGIVAFGLEFLIAAVIMSVAGLAQIAFWVRDKTQCRTVYDVRHKTIQTEVDCQIKDGKIIIIAPGGKVTIHDPGKLVDFEKVLQTAIKSGAEAAAKLITAGTGTFDKE